MSYTIKIQGTDPKPFDYGNGKVETIYYRHDYLKIPIDKKYEEVEVILADIMKRFPEPDFNVELEHDSFKMFLDNCTACGGNWTRMLMTGIEHLFPDFYKAMPDKNYNFVEIGHIVYALLDGDIPTVDPKPHKLSEMM